MNNTLQEFARKTILDGLLKLPEGQQLFFKRLYSHKNLDTPIEEVVKRMPEGKLNWVMEQVRRSLEKEALKGGREG